MPLEHGDRTPVTTAQFTGVSPAPWVGPPNWADALAVYDDDAEDEETDADDEEMDADDEEADVDARADAPHGRDDSDENRTS
jgi:hypothetical protein